MFEVIWKRIVRRRRLSFLSIPAFLLWIAVPFYRIGFILSRMFSSSPKKVKVPVISVGNITVGGTGKTPIVGFLASALVDEGVRVGIVSSGYRRESIDSIMRPGYKIIELDVRQTGDEVMLLAHHLPDVWFAIDSSKLVSAQMMAESSEVDVILVDDGYQHFGLHRDVDIVAYDAALKRNWLKSFPYGMLREPFSALERADIIIITRAKFATDIGKLKERLSRIAPDASMYHASFEAGNLIGRNSNQSIKYLEDKSVYLFAGVGNFRPLKQQVTALSADLDYALELLDHQRYDKSLLEKIKRDADKYDSDVLLTTAKDWVKLGDFDFGREIYYLDLSIDLDPGEERMVKSLMTQLKLGSKSD